GIVNLPALAIMLITSGALYVGTKESAIANNTMVILKLTILALVVAVGVFYVTSSNLQPFVVPHEGGFGHFGWSGVVRAAAVVFVSYLGFDAIATLAQDTRNPQRNMPIGILGSLGAVGFLYIAVALVLTGLVSYRVLDAPNPLSIALRGAGPALGWLLPVVDTAAVVGLGSVVLVVMLAQPRVLMAMSRDGLVPSAFARVHARFHTPYRGTMICGLAVAILAGLFPLSILVQLVSVGTLIVFIAVALSVIVLRQADPERPRPFRTPFVPYVPVAGILVCVGLLLNIPLRTWAVYGIWFVIGGAIYLLYGGRSAARHRIAAVL
ncbi:MAG TPA: amino acid permease, partial [Steroidobacteraceae bacterium]|nr:amino acid permease [Steroidobacteraceae bacterium]